MARTLVAAVVIVGLMLASLSPVSAVGAGPAIAAPNDVPESDMRSCATARPAEARCHARIRTDSKVRGKVPLRRGEPAQPNAGALGNGGAYDPAYLQSAYNVMSVAVAGGVGQTVAIVDAFDDPTAEADLATYRSHFGLSACTSATGCFRKVNQTGLTGPLPAADAGWAQEISVDVDMVSAICPNCNILLIEASSASFADLGAAVNMAASMGATAINNSYGSAEWSGETGYWDAFYNHPGIAVTASAGDAGYGVEFPASTPYTIAVGGTTLNQLTNTGVRSATETVWSGSGAGCSAFEPKPAWQHDSGCAQRTVADVAAVADPGTGVWVYDSTDDGGQSGWLVFGGTSVAAPIVASIYALSSTHGVSNASSLYAAPGGSLFDIVAGSDGTCALAYLCTGLVGYDGPTGNGTLNSTAAFGGGTVGSATNTPTPTPTATSTSTSTATPTASPTPVTSGGTLGLTSVGSVQDDGDSNAMNGSRIVVGSQSMSITSISAYVGAIDAAPRNQFSLAIYSDSGGAPAALAAKSVSGTLKANAWNTLPISVALQANTAYWLMYNTNAGSALLNNLTYNNDPSVVGAYGAASFGTWPVGFGGVTTGRWRYAMYVSSGQAATPTSTPTSTATATPTSTPTAAPTSTPTSTPTAAPTSTPTATPTSTPMATATSTPTATASPTSTPTASPTSTPTATPTAGSGGTAVTLGVTSVGSTADMGDANWMNGSRVVVGPLPLSATSISAYVGAIDTAPRNQFSLAIYSDSNGKPAALVAQTANGTLKAKSWNTLPIAATLNANTAYWIFYNTNAGSGSLNNLYYDTDPSEVGAYGQVTFGTWPSTYGASTLGGWRYTLYISGTS